MPLNLSTSTPSVSTPSAPAPSTSAPSTPSSPSSTPSSTPAQTSAPVTSSRSPTPKNAPVKYPQSNTPQSTSPGSQEAKPPPTSDDNFSGLFDETPATDNAEQAETPEDSAETPAETLTTEDDLVLKVNKETEDSEDKAEETPATEQPAVETPKAKRDYSALDKEVAEVAKGLPNSYFNKHIDKLKSWKDAFDTKAKLEAKVEAIAKEKPRFLNEHPEAYKIDPIYTKAAAAVGQARWENSHWEQQLARIDNGEDWIEYQGLDANGQPIYAQHAAPTDGKIDNVAQRAILRRMSTVDAEAAQHERVVKHIATNYPAAQKAATAELNGIMAKIYNGETPDKLAPNEAKHFKDTINMLPAGYQDSPLAPALGMAMVFVRRVLANHSATLKKYEALKNGGAKPATVGPRKTVSGGTTAANTGLIDADDFFGYGKQ